MENLKYFVKFGFVLYAVSMGFSSFVSASVDPSYIAVGEGPWLFGEENLLGNWKYSVEDVPYEYAKGILFISKQEGKLTVEVALRGGKRKAQDVKIEGGTLTFNLQLEGPIVAVSITADGDKINGKASSEDGIFPLTGERRLDPE